MTAPTVRKPTRCVSKGDHHKLLLLDTPEDNICQESEKLSCQVQHVDPSYWLVSESLYLLTFSDISSHASLTMTVFRFSCNALASKFLAVVFCTIVGILRDAVPLVLLDCMCLSRRQFDGTPFHIPRHHVPDCKFYLLATATILMTLLRIPFPQYFS